MFTSADLDALRGANADFVRKIGLACSKVNALGAAQTQEAEKTPTPSRETLLAPPSARAQHVSRARSTRDRQR